MADVGGPQLTMGDVPPGQAVLWYRRKKAEQAMRSKQVGSAPLWSPLQFLLLTFLSDVLLPGNVR